MITDKIKYTADFLLSLPAAGGAGKNYKQLPLPLALVVCIIALILLGILCSAGIMILINFLK
jgi:hypothetical protein